MKRRGNRNSNHIHGRQVGVKAADWQADEYLTSASSRRVSSTISSSDTQSKQTHHLFERIPRRRGPFSLRLHETGSELQIQSVFTSASISVQSPCGTRASKRKIINIWRKRRLMRNFLRGLSPPPSSWHWRLWCQVSICFVSKCLDGSFVSLAPETLDPPLIRLSEPWCDGLLEPEPETIKIHLTSHNSSRTSQRNQSSLSLLLFLFQLVITYCKMLESGSVHITLTCESSETQKSYCIQCLHAVVHLSKSVNTPTIHHDHTEVVSEGSFAKCCLSSCFVLPSTVKTRRRPGDDWCGTTKEKTFE